MALVEMAVQPEVQEPPGTPAAWATLEPEAVAVVVVAGGTITLSVFRAGGRQQPVPRAPETLAPPGAMWLVEVMVALALLAEARQLTPVVPQVIPETQGQLELPVPQVLLVIPEERVTPAALAQMAIRGQRALQVRGLRPVPRVTPEARPRQPTLTQPL